MVDVYLDEVDVSIRIDIDDLHGFIVNGTFQQDPGGCVYINKYTSPKDIGDMLKGIAAGA